MSLKDIVVCGLGSELLCKSVLVDDTSRAVELLEYRWGDPRLQNEPTTKVYSANLLVDPIERCLLLNSFVEESSASYISSFL